jgi:hypothetical protein
VLLFDCRGYAPVEYVFDGGWKAESVSFPHPFFFFFLFFFLTQRIENVLV